MKLIFSPLVAIFMEFMYSSVAALNLIQFYWLIKKMYMEQTHTMQYIANIISSNIVLKIYMRGIYSILSITYVHDNIVNNSYTMY